MVKSEKTGAYVFKEQSILEDADIKAYFAN